MSRWAVVVAVAGCGGDVGPRALHYDLGTCGVVDILDTDPGNHVAQGTVIEWSTNPPTSGPHFQIWAAYDRAYSSLDRGFWVHDLEHGAIVLLHRCDPAACPDTVAALSDVVRAFPDDGNCVAPVRNRAIVVFDPLLPEGIEVAAVGWGVMYAASCVDPVALAVFRNDFYNRAPEKTCANGASLGGTAIE